MSETKKMCMMYLLVYKATHIILLKFHDSNDGAWHGFHQHATVTNKDCVTIFYSSA